MPSRVITDIKEFIRKILSKNKDEVQAPSDWVQDAKTEEDYELITEPSMTSVIVKKPKKLRLRIPGWFKIKRFYGGLVLFITFFICVACFTDAYMFWLFASYFFLLLDYLWQSRTQKLTWDDKR